MLVGNAEIGSTFLSDIVSVKGVKLVGPLPAAIGNATAYAAGIRATSANREAAGRFIALLAARGGAAPGCSSGSAGLG